MQKTKILAVAPYEGMADILTGIILFFIIGSEFFINYKINFRSKKNGEVSK